MRDSEAPENFHHKNVDCFISTFYAQHDDCDDDDDDDAQHDDEDCDDDDDFNAQHDDGVRWRQLGWLPH